MGTKRINITDIFETKSCDLCGSNELSQFFGVNESFIEYSGIYYPLREILSESLSFQISKEDGESMEICLDCKDKSMKFYHFKRKIKDVQENKSNKKVKIGSQKYSKVIHNIYKIIENYTEKCSVSEIRVEESEKKLIIEASKNNKCRKPQKKRTISQEFDDNSMDIVTSIVKQENPLEENFVDENFSDYDDDDYSANYIQPSTSFINQTKRKTPKKSPRSKQCTKKLKDENVVGSITLSASEADKVFDDNNSRFKDKYGDVFRRIIYDKYQTRIRISFSYVGKSIIRTTVSCEKCLSNYKVEGFRDDFISGTDAVCTIKSTNFDFCRCGFKDK